MKVRVYHNGDDVFVAWKPAGFIDHCRGFALLRRRNGVEEVVSTWVGFEGQHHEEGERRASTNWPIQRYQWTDYMASPGDTLQYRVLPMVGPDYHNLQPETTLASEWTEEITLTHEVEPGISVFFNRGIVAAQWVSRRLGQNTASLAGKKLEKVINTPHDPFRDYLAGPLGRQLFELLANASQQNLHIYAALYELEDEQLEEVLETFGPRAHVILANGSVHTKGGDQNHEARSRLRNKIDLHDRMIAPGRLGHNKFLVLCDEQDQPRWVWTGSQNWTKTGLCTQANNSVLIDDPAIAREYLNQWNLLLQAGNKTPATLKKNNSLPRSMKVKNIPIQLWFTPTVRKVDLQEARAVIEAAQQAILFLMFNPGPQETLLNKILEKAQSASNGNRLYIRGALNQDPSTARQNVQLFHESNSEKADFNVVLPAAIDEATEWFAREIRKLPKGIAMVHSKVVVVDPFGEHPVVITGSHNLGPKASSGNDENLLIFRDAHGLAAAYATNVMSIYHQYRWRLRRQLQSASKRWKGLQDGDQWQQGYLQDGSMGLRELSFWVGEQSDGV